MSWICNQCDYETDNHTEYKLHLTTHSPAPIPPNPVEIPEIKENDQITTAQNTSKTADSDKPLVVPPWDKALLAKKERGIELQYRFDGVCSECLTEVETLELPNLTEKNKIAVVAYCVKCKKQLQTEIVAKL